MLGRYGGFGWFQVGQGRGGSTVARERFRDSTAIFLIGCDVFESEFKCQTWLIVFPLKKYSLANPRPSSRFNLILQVPPHNFDVV